MQSSRAALSCLLNRRDGIETKPGQEGRLSSASQQAPVKTHLSTFAASAVRATDLIFLSALRRMIWWTMRPNRCSTATDLGMVVLLSLQQNTLQTWGDADPKMPPVHMDQRGGGV